MLLLLLLQGFLACSLLGTFYHGYFFAFHLLHIINTNVLLGAAIKAVTANGPYIYIYARYDCLPQSFSRAS